MACHVLCIGWEDWASRRVDGVTTNSVDWLILYSLYRNHSIIDCLNFKTNIWMNEQINLVLWRDLHSRQIIPIQQHIPIGGWEFIVRNTNEFTLIDIPFFFKCLPYIYWILHWNIGLVYSMWGNLALVS